MVGHDKFPTAYCGAPALMKEVGDVEGVAHVQRFCNKEGILKTDADFKGILLHGVGRNSMRLS